MSDVFAELAHDQSYDTTRTVGLGHDVNIPLIWTSETQTNIITEYIDSYDGILEM